MTFLVFKNCEILYRVRKILYKEPQIQNISVLLSVSLSLLLYKGFSSNTNICTLYTLHEREHKHRGHFKKDTRGGGCTCCSQKKKKRSEQHLRMCGESSLQLSIQTFPEWIMSNSTVFQPSVAIRMNCMLHMLQILPYVKLNDS